VSLAGLPDGFRNRAAWAIETLSSTCAGAPEADYPGPRLAGSERAWEYFAAGAGDPPALAPGGLLDFGDGVEDVVASAFWHLSRWEERPGSPRDRHGRFPGSAALADPEHPAVDALAERFRDALGAAPADRPFTVALTHDIDVPLRWSSRRALAGAAARARAAATAGRSSELAAELRGLAAAPIHHLRGSDPNWSFARIHELERLRGARSTHFVLAGHTHPADGPDYDRARSAVVAQVLGQGDELALHPSYEASARPQLLDEQRARLEALAGAPVRGVRFHYLRHDTHRTLPLLAARGFAYDSSQGYADRPGLRAGFSHPYRPYDLAADRPLDLVELPLAVMDATLAEARYLHLDAGAGFERAAALLERVAAARGTVALLWHNDRFDRASARGWDAAYERLLDWVVERGGRLVSAAEAVA
jgi:Family of unknown function (DUF7033)